MLGFAPVSGSPVSGTDGVIPGTFPRVTVPGVDSSRVTVPGVEYQP